MDQSTPVDINHVSPSYQSGGAKGEVPPVQSTQPSFVSARRLSTKGLFVLGILIALLVGSFFAVSELLKKPEKPLTRVETGPKLVMMPPLISAKVGETAEIRITLDTQTDTVSAGELHLTYDPSAVRILGFTVGSILPVELTKFSDTSGTAVVALGALPTSPYKGADTVGTLQIKILSAKQSSLEFANTTKIASVGKNTNSLMSSAGTVCMGLDTVSSSPAASMKKKGADTVDVPLFPNVPPAQEVLEQKTAAIAAEAKKPAVLQWFHSFQTWLADAFHL
jgi:hypothetical protein